MTKLVNRAKMTTATTGTGTITLGSAVDGFQTFTDAGVSNSDVVRYVIEDGANWEIGSGTYSAGTLTRTVSESSNADAAINLSGEAVVYVTAAAADIQQPPSEGAFVDGDKTKLDGIEAGATADQTITAGSGLTGGGTGNVTLSHADTSAQASVNNSGATVIQDVTLDTYGHVTALGSTTLTLATLGYTGETNATADQTIIAGAGLTGGGTGDVTISHADTSTQASVNNSGRTYIQDITLDTYGHVTGLTSATETVVNSTSLPIENSSGVIQFTSTDTTGLQFASSGSASVAFDAANQRVTISATDTNTTYTASSGLSLTGTTFSHADTSSQASVDNTGATVIQDVTLDTYGHVTGLGSKTLTAADLGAITGNQTITLSGDVSGSGTTSIVVTVADDSHNHIIANVDGLQTALDGKSATTHNHTLDSLSNTTITSNTAGEILKWNGSAWVNNTLAEAGIQPAGSYLTANQTITLSGDLTGSGTTSINAQLAANVVGANELNVTGNGTTAQYLRSDGDGSFTWATPTDTNTTYSAGGGLTLAGTVFSHTDTSAQASVNNSGATFIQDVTLDTYGHVTGLASATITASGIGALASTNPVILSGTLTEDVYAISGTSVALEPDNGSVQTHTLTGNTTYTDAFSSGQAITLMIDDGSARTITWPSMVWVNNERSAPTLATTGYTVVSLWKVGATLYGALVGDGS